MSLYRTYRPSSFEEVVGQKAIIATLSQAVEQDKLSHAYLFSGTRGSGKTSVARILAKTLLTRGVQDATLKRQIIEAVDEGSLVDLTEIDAASNRGIDDIRSLLEKIQFTPVVASAKVYIIDEVHMLTREAFNALLKTLEEPPAYAYFILATTELHKIPATIQSRCQRFLFTSHKEEDMVERLQFICEKEKIHAEPEALRTIAHAAQGSLRDAISLLDQLRTLSPITALDVKSRTGETGHEYVERTLSACQAKDRPALLGIVRSLEEAAVPMENFLRLLLRSIRSGLQADVEEGKDPTQSLRSVDILLESLRNVRNSPVPGLIVESALLSLCAPIANASPAAPHPAHVHAASPISAPPPLPIKPTPTATPAAQAAPATTTPSPTSEATPITLDSLKTLWPQIVDETSPPAVRMSLKNGHIHAVTHDSVTLCFTSNFHREKVSTIEAARTIEDILERHLKRHLNLTCVLETEAHTPPLPPTSDVVDLAKAAAEIF